jgi:hypothetical protein
MSEIDDGSHSRGGEQKQQQHSQYEDDLDSLLNQGQAPDRAGLESKYRAQASTSSRDCYLDQPL